MQQRDTHIRLTEDHIDKYCERYIYIIYGDLLLLLLLLLTSHKESVMNCSFLSTRHDSEPCTYVPSHLGALPCVTGPIDVSTRICSRTTLRTQQPGYVRGGRQLRLTVQSGLRQRLRERRWQLSQLQRGPAPPLSLSRGHTTAVCSNTYSLGAIQFLKPNLRCVCTSGGGCRELGYGSIVHLLFVCIIWGIFLSVHFLHMWQRTCQIDAGSALISDSLHYDEVA